VSRRVTLALAAIATALLLVAALAVDRPGSSAWVPAVLLAAAAVAGAVAVIGAWSSPRAQSSADGSVAGPT